MSTPISVRRYYTLNQVDYGEDYTARLKLVRSGQRNCSFVYVCAA